MKKIRAKVNGSWRRTTGRRASGGPETHFIIEVDDDASGTRILEMELSAGDLMRVLSSSHTSDTVEIEVTTVAHRIGKKMEMSSESWSRTGYRDQNVEELAQQACDEWLANGWETATWSRTNFGASATARKWVDIEPE